VPAERPPRIRMRDEIYTWKEGESILFDDSWDHEVFNDSSELRAVLIVDVLRPMPRIPALVNRGAAFAARYLYGRKVLARVRDHANSAK
jgi:aspartyl/asparaginyl beta-hydroxylase (cupin superfamily)